MLILALPLAMLVAWEFWSIIRFGIREHRIWCLQWIAAADSQHEALLNGDMHYGVYGAYPPAVECASVPPVLR